MRLSRKLGVILVVALLLSMFVTSAALAEGEPVATVTAYMLNVRSGPGGGYSIVTQIPLGTQVAMLGRDSNSVWVAVRLLDGTEGWVHSFWIESETPVSSLAPVTAYEPVGVVQAGKLNVRSGPGTGYPAISAASQLEFLMLLGRDSETVWVKVQQADGTVGWVNSKWIYSSSDLTALPLLTTYEAPAIVTAGKLNVRSGPGVTYDPMGAVVAWDVLMLIGRDATGGWAYVRVPNGSQGWVSTYYIDTLDMAVSALPVVTGE